MKLPPGFTAIGRTENSPFAVIENYRKGFYGIQFHPEVFHTERGIEVLLNFLAGVCRARQDWTTKDFIEHAVRRSARRWAGPA
jgi:GMP synthase (glutamine-hydrolysing)